MSKTEIFAAVATLVIGLPLSFVGGIWLSWYQNGGLPFWEYLWISYFK